MQIAGRFVKSEHGFILVMTVDGYMTFYCEDNRVLVDITSRRIMRGDIIYIDYHEDRCKGRVADAISK